MESNKLFNLVQVGTGIALIIGLALVFIELQQAKSLTLAELTSEAYAEAMAEFRTVMGENSATAFAKACFEPDKLSNEELVVLNAYFNTKILQVARLRVLERVEEFGVPWEAVARQQLLEILSTQPGRLWFDNVLAAD